jgi:hypothetical protein
MTNNYIFKSQGKNWFYRLKGENGLLENIRDEEKLFGLIVAFVNAEEKRYFTCFESFIECIQMMIKVPEHQRNYHEVVFDFRNQKMRFDIDIKKKRMMNDVVIENIEFPEVQKFLDCLIENIIRVYSEIGYQLIPEKHILVFSSHGEEKWSFHIIIDGFYCENCHEAAELFRMITDKMEHIDWLDASIYNPNHSLRMLLSSKNGRTKKLEKKWMFKDKEIVFEYSETPRNEKHQTVLEFERSFISLTENCFPIPCMVKKDLSKSVKFDTNVDNDVLDYSYRLFVSLYGKVFGYERSVGSLVLLKRLEPSGCPICERTHEVENGFLWIKPVEGNGMTTNEIYFDCRRSGGKKIMIGSKVVVKGEVPVVEKKSNVGFSVEEIDRISRKSKKSFL